MSKSKTGDVRKSPAGESKNRMGRPMLEVDFKRLAICCKFRMTQEDIAELFGMSADTLNARIQERFNMTFPEFQKSQKISLRQKIFQKQYKLAIIKENPWVLMRLGEIYCDQSDEAIKNQNKDPGDQDVTFNIGFSNDQPEPPKADTSTTEDPSKPEKI